MVPVPVLWEYQFAIVELSVHAFVEPLVASALKFCVWLPVVVIPTCPHPFPGIINKTTIATKARPREKSNLFFIVFGFNCAGSVWFIFSTAVFISVKHLCKDIL